MVATSRYPIRSPALVCWSMMRWHLLLTSDVWRVDVSISFDNYKLFITLWQSKLPGRWSMCSSLVMWVTVTVSSDHQCWPPTPSPIGVERSRPLDRSKTKIWSYYGFFTRRVTYLQRYDYKLCLLIYKCLHRISTVISHRSVCTGLEWHLSGAASIRLEQLTLLSTYKTRQIRWP